MDSVTGALDDAGEAVGMFEDGMDFLAELDADDTEELMGALFDEGVAMFGEEVGLGGLLETGLSFANDPGAAVQGYDWGSQFFGSVVNSAIGAGW